MPYTTSGGGAGGGGIVFRTPPDIFTGADLAACRTARDTFFNTAGNASVLGEYQGNQSLGIVLDPTNSTDNVFETYLPGNVGLAYDNTQWVDRTDAVEGNPGDQAQFPVIIHTNSAAQPTPATPIGGSFDIPTGVLTPPTGTTEAPSSPGVGEDVWASQAIIDPANQSGAVIPTWSEWVERSHLSSGISHVETTEDFTGTGLASDPLTAAVTLAQMLDLGDSPTQTGAMFAYAAPALGYTAGGFLTSGQFVQFDIGTVSSPDDSDVIIRVGTDDYTLVALGGLAVKLFEIVDDTKYLAFGKGDVLLLLGPTDGSGRVVDITEAGLPPADADAIGKIYVDRLVPAAWMIHEVPHANTPVMGTFDTYVSARDSNDNFDLFQGPMAADFFTLRVGIADQTLDSRHVGLFYWNWRDHVFREWVQTFNQQTSTFNYHWQSAHNPGVLLGGTTGVYLGYDTLDSALLRRMPRDQIDATRRYIGVATHGAGSDEFREFDNSSYVAAVAPFNVYDFVTIGLYGTGGNAGQTLGQVTNTIEAFLNTLIATIDGAGITNTGTTLAPVLNVDPTEADFPTIPVDKGGTGATDAAAARTALGVVAAYIKTQYEANADTNAFTDALLTKLMGVDMNARDDQTGAEIVALIEALAGVGRLNASALRLIADQIDTELGSSDWRTGGTGGSDTAQQILTKLLTVDGAGSGLDADLLDGMTPAQVAALGGGGGTQSYYPIPSADVGGTANAITLTTGHTLTAYAGGMLFFFNSADVNTGATTVNVDGIGARNIQKSRYRLTNGVVTTASEALEGGEITENDPIMLVYGSQFDEFYLLPSRAGTASYRNVGRDALDLVQLETGNVFPVDVIPTEIARTSALAAYALIAQNLADLDNIATARTNLGLGTAATRDTGAAENNLALLESGGVFAGARIPNLGATYAAFADGGTFAAHLGGITPTVDAHFATKSYVDGLVNPVQAHTNYAALKATNTFVAADFTAVGSSASSTTSAITVPAFAADSYLAFAIPDSQPDLTDIRETGSAFSSFSSFERVAGTIMIGGEAHKVWRSTIEFLANSNAQSWTVT